MDEYNAITELMKLIPTENKDKARILINKLTAHGWGAAKRRFLNSEKRGIYSALDKALFYTFEYSLDQATARSNKPEVCSIRQIIAYYLIVNLSYSDQAASEIVQRDRCTMAHSVKAVRNRIVTTKGGYRELENFSKIMNMELGILTTENLEVVENTKPIENIGVLSVAKQSNAHENDVISYHISYTRNLIPYEVLNLGDEIKLCKNQESEQNRDNQR